MELNKYPPARLRDLLLIISIANEESKPKGQPDYKNESIAFWAKEANAALNDSEFEAKQLPFPDRKVSVTIIDEIPY
jgi:hypothetical protein